MKLKYKIIIIIVILLKYFCVNIVKASTLSSISVQNHPKQSMVTIHCDTAPVYTIFSLHKPERIVIDFLQIFKIQKHVFPIEFNNNNLMRRMRTSTPVNSQSTRIVCDLNYESSIQTIIQKKIGKNYCIILKFSKKIVTTPNLDNQSLYPMTMTNQKIYDSLNQKNQFFSEYLTKKKSNIKQNTAESMNITSPIIVAIDAGHGGHDPGATSRQGIYEKNITFSIATKLKKILDIDPIFKAVMIRDGDYFLSVTERSDLARKKRANILISIHADSSVNSKIRGASIWILSNRRAKIEMVHWLQCKEKHAELLGGVGDILTNYRNDPYFNHLVLDLQFGYAQRESYNIAQQMLHQLKNISFLHKNVPEYSGFGVLRSPDITSVLVETGFISNIQDAYLLTTHRYQEKIAQALYKGLRSYFSIHHQESKL